jgi:hypothetical protein
MVFVVFFPHYKITSRNALLSSLLNLALFEIIFHRQAPMSFFDKLESQKGKRWETETSGNVKETTAFPSKDKQTLSPHLSIQQQYFLSWCPGSLPDLKDTFPSL